MKKCLFIWVAICALFLLSAGCSCPSETASSSTGLSDSSTNVYTSIAGITIGDTKASVDLLEGTGADSGSSRDGMIRYYPYIYGYLIVGFAGDKVVTISVLSTAYSVAGITVGDSSGTVTSLLGTPSKTETETELYLWIYKSKHVIYTFDTSSNLVKSITIADSSLF
jgi:hypothetical protein